MSERWIRARTRTPYYQIGIAPDCYEWAGVLEEGEILQALQKNVTEFVVFWKDSVLVYVAQQNVVELTPVEVLALAGEE